MLRYQLSADRTWLRTKVRAPEACLRLHRSLRHPFPHTIVSRKIRKPGLCQAGACSFLTMVEVNAGGVRFARNDITRFSAPGMTTRLPLSIPA